MIKKESLKQFFKFAIVGVLNTFINMGVLYVFTEYLKVYYIVSAIFAFLVAVTNSFILNKIWTFKEDIKDKTTKKYSKFFIISVLALITNLSLLYVFTEVFKFYYLISQVIAIAVSLWINFLGNKFWTFKNV